ncbi:MAG: NAD(P)/FAD-dependent oxidoreductase [Myxococcota bacterium]|nr:NAD(P)/FAD-dependent oxidoreductase [Myxococcota bacterium]
MSGTQKYDAVVIGAGPNGLIASAYLAKAGNKVLLLERRHETGGGLNTDEYHGFRLNLHATYHMMAEQMPAYLDLGLPDLGVRYLQPPVGAAFPFADGRSMIFTGDPAETATSIETFSPDDARCYVRMWEEFQPILDQYLIPMTYELPEPALDQMVEFEKTPVGSRLAAISEYSFIEMVDDYGFKDPRVRMALLSLPAMWGLHLDEPLGFLFPLYLCRMLNASLVKGGSHRLSSAIYRSFLQDGGRVMDMSEAQKIVFDGDRAVAVEVDGGERFEADAVISTLNPEQTFGQLIAEEDLPEDVALATQNWEWEERTLFGLHLGIHGKVGYRAEDPRVDDALVVLCGLETEDELHAHLARVDAGQETECDWLHITVPSRFDATMAPPGHQLIRAEAVVHYDQPWETEAKAFGDSAIARLQKFAEVGDIVLRRECTPRDIEQKLTTMKRGSFKHGAYSTLQMGYLRPNDLCSHCATPIPGLFVGGASVYPGGMVLGGPGYLAARVVGEELGRPIPERG